MELARVGELANFARRTTTEPSGYNKQRIVLEPTLDSSRSTRRGESRERGQKRERERENYSEPLLL